jgi:hypothetical protein
MGRENAAWFVMALLLLLTVLMCVHLATLWVSLTLCAEYAELLLDLKAKDPTFSQARSDPSCANFEATFSEAVDKYLSVILSLIGGAAVSGGYATAVAPIPPNRKDDEP